MGASYELQVLKILEKGVLLNKNRVLKRLMGFIQQLKKCDGTYHPAHILRNKSLKINVFQNNSVILVFFKSIFY